MLIVLALYFGLTWLVFYKLKLLPWNGASKTVVYLGALVITLVVIGALKRSTPSGTVSVQGAVISVTPNVAGTVTELLVEPNKPVSAGDVLFRMDDTKQVAEVARLEASLSTAEATADQLLNDLEASQAEIESLEAQLTFGIQRRDDIIQLADRGASAEFRLQEAVSTIEQLDANLRAATARKTSLERRISAQIDGVDVGIVETQNQLKQARWELDQTVVRAPADGQVTGLTLRVGNRVSTLQGALNFVVPDDRKLIATLPQSSLQNVSTGDEIRIALRTLPGQEFKAIISDIPMVTDEGAIDTRSSLASLRELTGSSDYIVIADVPEINEEQWIKFGASGTALVISEDAGAIAVLAEILFWISKMTNYL
ncbi:HlyD family secretion protein [Shimia sp. MIT1388]|uniref:HlyD family secretion protein n=1 Tax=Shimia sp. MIT1388 TaxID=3096992 RepID=UPI00399989A1